MSRSCDPFITRLPPRSPAGEGPLAGVTLAIKDNFDVAGAVTGNGAPEWAAAHAPAAQDAPLVARLLALGLVPVGKTHMDELAYSLMGVNARYGTPPNPAAPDRAPGGSSSGTASATAAGLCDVGLGSDTGGSVRIPASFCGLYGWRPTHGALPGGGLAPLAPSFDVPGFMTRDLALLDAVANALLEAGADDAPPRLLAPADAWAMARTGTSAALEPALAALEARHGQADRRPLYDGDPGAWLGCFRTHQAHEIWKALGCWVLEHEPAFGPGVRERFAWASTVTDAQFREAAERRTVLAGRLLDVLGPDGVLALPTAPGPAPLLDAGPEEMEAYRNAALTLLCVAGLAGAPQVTIPAGRAEGAPVGLSLVGPPGADLRLLRLAGAVPRA